MDKAAFEKIQNIVKRIIASPNMIKIISLIIFAELMLLPFGMDKMDLFNTEKTPILLYPLSILGTEVVQKGLNFFYISCLLFFLMPAAFIAIFISFFPFSQKKLNKKTVYFLAVIPTTLYLSTAVAGMVVFANTVRWFYALNFSVYFAFFTALIFHIFLIAYGIISIKKRNGFYTEYKRLLKEEEKREIETHKKAIEKLKKQTSTNTFVTENDLNMATLLKRAMNSFKNSKKKTHIKTKITIVILFTIIIILSTFIYTDLRNYKALLTQTVNNTGKNQAEQVAAIYSFSDGLHAKISAFLEGIKQTNASSPFPCQRVDIIITNSKNPVFIEQVNSPGDLPSFDVFSYTTAAGQVRKIPDEEKRITPEQAALYIQRFKNEYTRSEPVYKPEKGTCIYVYPIAFSRKEGQKLLGFSVVTYLKEILDRPYFQVKVFIFALSAVFLYISIIVTLFLADFIANPVIFLCGNIRKTANILGEMLSGNANIEADRLVFEENINTHDEIKKLSIEIKNMITLIRGILPYVSFHTIRNAERNISRMSSTRDLCFLFTDIRGFTSLCETIPPKDVIRILNRYLDIETKIIFENGGDVDKYVGDAIMAFFAGPKKEINACKAAMEIKKAMHREKQEAAKEGSASISIGIGISSGSVVFGSVGAQTRKDFTSIGDTVNLAARLEGANKEYGSSSIISESVYEKLNDDFICRELDYVAVKGKTEPVRIFEILQLKESANDKVYDLKNTFETGLSYYRTRNWEKAEEYFSEGAEKFNDVPSKIFLRRVIHYKISPPKQDWKGVFIMNSK